MNFDEREREREREYIATYISLLLVFLPQKSLLLYKVHVCVYTLKLSEMDGKKERERERGWADFYLNPE